MNEEKSDKNDWDNIDDDWEEWGDAEDNLETKIEEKQQQNNNEDAITKQILESKTTATKTTDANSNQTVKDGQSTSWASMLKPFGGVVSSITTTVSQGINQVIGVPDPEELARINAAEIAKSKESSIQADNEEAKTRESPEEHSSSQPTGPNFGLDFVTTFGSKVLNTGLDTLEGIGKKTMTILQENDPLLMNKRKLLKLESERPNLSAVLQEAKKDADQLENTLKQLQIEKTKSALHFEPLFENHCGLVHLEALEILSKESTLKLEKLLEAVSGQALRELQETLNEVKELMELEDLEGESEGDYTSGELNELLTNAIEDMDLKIGFDDLVKTWSSAVDWLEKSASSETDQIQVDDVFAHGITTLAETCALEMNKLHKIAELLLVKEHHSTANEVDAIVQLCKQFITHLNGLTNRYAITLSGTKDNEEAKSFTSTLFSEMLLATQQIEKAFKLFLPILQIGAV